MSALESAIRGGQPSTTTPIPPPCDSPKVVTRKSWPKVLPMCACHFDRADESLNSRKCAITKPAIVLPRVVSVIPSESRGISNYFLEKSRCLDFARHDKRNMRNH